MEFGAGGTEPPDLRRGVGARFDGEAGGLELAAEAVLEDHSGRAVAGLVKRPTGREGSAVGGGFGRWWCRPVWPSISKRAESTGRVEARAQLDLGADERDDRVAERLFAGCPTGVVGKIEADFRIGQLGAAATR